MTPRAPVRLLAAARRRASALVERLSPRQRQFALLGAITAAAVTLLWVVMASSGSKAPVASGGATPSKPADKPSSITNIGVLPPGAQVNPIDQWIGTAGRKLAQYESERDEQTRLNKDRQAFEAKTMQRFAELEQRLLSSQQAAAQPGTAPAPVVPAKPMPAAPAPGPTGSTTSPARPNHPGQADFPPAANLPLPPPIRRAGAELPAERALPVTPHVPSINRISLVDRQAGVATPVTSQADSGTTSSTPARTAATFLPVGFTRGVLLGGLDAPTGGQAQSNPHPVLIRLSDTSVLPNRVRGDYRDCFVIAAGYGDISSERAYLRTESLSCMRSDGAVLEVKIQGSVYGEDGKVGMRGRLVTKQGQILANALLAGVVSGIGHGLSTSATEYSTSPLGTVASATGADALRAGVGTGVGKALDRLAQYYIKLAENTFPIIEVDAGREIDVVITKGSRIDVPSPLGHRGAGPHLARTPSSDRNLERGDDDDY